MIEFYFNGREVVKKSYLQQNIFQNTMSVLASAENILIYIQILDLFRLMDCEKKSLKIHFSSAFLPSPSEYLPTSFLGEMKNIIVMSIYSYLFPMRLLRKIILFFSYSSMLYFDSLRVRSRIVIFRQCLQRRCIRRYNCWWGLLYIFTYIVISIGCAPLYHLSMTYIPNCLICHLIATALLWPRSKTAKTTHLPPRY